MGVEDQDVISPDTSANEATLDDVVASPAEAVVSEDAADPSPAAKDEKSVLSIVRNAVEPKAAPDPSTGKESDHQDASKKEPDDENFSDVPFHQHPRFRALVQQRNEYRGPAEQFRKVEAFLTENAMTGEDASAALNWFALRKRDPEAAWAEMKPFIQELLVQIGEVLPPDLREQVATGRLQADVAKALAKERAKATIAQGQMSFRDQQTAARQRREQAEASMTAQNAVRQAARDWDTQMRGKDADFTKKLDEIRREVLDMQYREGKKPDTPEAVRAQLAAAYKAVNARFAAARPRRPEVRPVTGGSTSGSPRAEPKSILDIVKTAGEVAH